MGPDRNTHLRNAAIVLVLAAAVWKLPGGGTAANVISNILGLIFAGGLVFFGYRLYMEHRSSLFMLRTSCGTKTAFSAPPPMRM